MRGDSEEYLRSLLTFYPDFPEPGIRFVDLMPLLADRIAYQHTIQELAEQAWKWQAEALAVIESRGFLFGAPVAFSLGIPLVPIRKKGKLPGETVSSSYALEYGTDTLELQKNPELAGKRVVILDDLLATGGTFKAACSLLEHCAANTVGALFVVELTQLNGFDGFNIEKKSLVTL